MNERFVDALETIRATLERESVEWALTGSTSLALQGVPVEPNDIDIQTTEDGAYSIETLFSDRVVTPVSFSQTDSIRSHFGELDIRGVSVEIIGDPQKRSGASTWDPPIDLESKREFVSFEGQMMPVLSLQYEANAYERLGKKGRATLIRQHVDE